MHLIILYLAAIISANLMLLWFGPQASIWNAFILIGLDLTIRDRLHDQWGDRLWIRMFALICTGSALTVAISWDAGQIAIASAVAFFVAGVGDAAVYHIMRKRKFLAKSNASNFAGSALDSLLFPLLAFGMFLPDISFYQFIAKVTGGALWAWGLNAISHRQVKKR